MKINFDIQQGTYKKKTEAKWIVDPSVAWVSYTINGRAPTLAQYIAYDQLQPPNPFLAVTQDGRGNAVFDGGFPKYYNMYAPAAGATFAQMNGSFKFLYNALNFCAKPGKARNVLFIGDAADDAPNYALKSAAPSGFVTSMQRICAAAGFTASFLSVTDYGGNLNPSFATLDQFCCVVLMSSAYPGVPLITKEAVQAFVQYREAGNGVIIITDHGVPDIDDIDEAVDGSYSAFYRTANMVAAEFGVYFTGNYDRTPVNVGFLRTTYGDHPLYANITNEESIQAGGSESKVVVFDYRKYTPGQLPPLAFVDGCYFVQVMAYSHDGTVEFSRYMFCIDKNAIVHVRRLYVRPNSNAPWIVNFDKGGWKVYNAAAERFIQMTSSNTLLWDKENKEWVNVK